MLEEHKKWSWWQDTIDQIMFKGPGWISFVMVCAKSTKKITVMFHNGVDTSGKCLIHIHTGTGDTKMFSPPYHVYFDKGCFVNIDGDTESFAVQYREEK